MRWRGRVILQLRCAVEAARLYCEGRTRTCRRGTCPNIGEDQSSTFLAGKHAKVSPAAEPQLFRVPWQSAIGNDQSVIAAVCVLFVVESQSPLRLDTSALWRRCLFSLGGGPLARAKLQRYPLSYARIAHTPKIRLKKTWPCREGSRDIGTFHASSPKAQVDLAGAEKES